MPSSGKAIPIKSGLGGGSSDVAAIREQLAERTARRERHDEATTRVSSDNRSVPVVASHFKRKRK